MDIHAGLCIYSAACMPHIVVYLTTNGTRYVL